MLSSKQIRRIAKQLFNSCKVDDTLDENRVRIVVNELIERKPRGYIQILKVFQRLVKLEIEKRTAYVETAVEIDTDLRNSIEANLKRQYGNRLRVFFSVNPDLIGGMKVKVGSNVFDSSIRNRLTELLQSF
jgi:F-type H+-transporting ATPase subunit delta